MKDQRHKSHDGDQHGLLATQKNGGVLREKDAWITKRATQCPASSSIIQVWPAAADGPNNTIRRIRWEIARKENNNESKAILIHCLALSVFFFFKKKSESERVRFLYVVGAMIVSLWRRVDIQRTAAAWPPGASLSYIAHAIWEKVGIEQQQPLEELRERERDFLRMWTIVQSVTAFSTSTSNRLARLLQTFLLLLSFYYQKG